jgi:hypothetical protein
LRAIALIDDPRVIRHILEHLGRSHARGLGRPGKRPSGR